MTQTIHFLLVPDRAAARKVRRAIAEESPRLGVLVGTWSALLEYARTSCLLPTIQQDFSEKLTTAVAQLEMAFWSESFAVAPADTLAVLGRELERLLHALGPGKEAAG